MGLIHYSSFSALCRPQDLYSCWYLQFVVGPRPLTCEEPRLHPNPRALGPENSLKLERIVGRLLEWLPQREAAVVPCFQKNLGISKGSMHDGLSEKWGCLATGLHPQISQNTCRTPWQNPERGQQARTLAFSGTTPFLWCLRHGRLSESCWLSLEPLPSLGSDGRVVLISFVWFCFSLSGVLTFCPGLRETALQGEGHWGRVCM